MTQKIWLTLFCLPLFVACAPSADTQTAEMPVLDAPQAPQNAIENVSAKEAAMRMLANPDITVLDIRTPGEYAAGHIEGAQLIDFKADDFKLKLAALDPDNTYVVHCRSGGRSTQSLAVFKELEFTSILHMNGGFNDWQASGLPVSQ